MKIWVRNFPRFVAEKNETRFPCLPHITVSLRVKQRHCRPGQARRVWGGCGSQISRKLAYEGGRIVSHTHWPPWNCLLRVYSVVNWGNCVARYKPEVIRKRDLRFPPRVGSLRFWISSLWQQGFVISDGIENFARNISPSAVFVVLRIRFVTKSITIIIFV